MKTLNYMSMLKKCFAYALVSAFACSITPAYAVHDLGLFELDGNAVQDVAEPPDDWETLYDGGSNNSDCNNAGGCVEFTGIIPDPQMGDDIFEGGKKDIQDVSQWSWKTTGGFPDKNDITNAYAAAYSDNGDLIVYYGADRFSNDGDAFLGFWFFQQEVQAVNGDFIGNHVNDDTLVLVNFPQATNAEPIIQVIVWDNTCTQNQIVHNNPQIGDCAAKNLRLISEGVGMAGAICGMNAAGDDACAITNLQNELSPWPYVPKSGPAGIFPEESFFEGGINLTSLIGNACFSSFLAETRSSSSFTATLKDFVLDEFPVCGVEITKECTAADINSDDTGFIYTFNGEVFNTGFATIHDVVVTDVTGGQIFNLGSIDAGQSKPYNGTFESPINGVMNTVTVAAATTPNGPKIITDGPVNAQCPTVDRDPMIEVDKECSTKLAIMNNKVVVMVDFDGMVCNTTSGDNAINLVDVKVVDDSGTPMDPADDQEFIIGDLDADMCKPYSGTYNPSVLNDMDPANAMFTDGVTATGDAVLGFGMVEDSSSATCFLCPQDP